MATSFDEIIDKALMSIDDYKLNKLYNVSDVKFQKFCDGLLVLAVPNFFSCKKSLNYNLDTREFESDFSMIEKDILSELWVIEWFGREVNTSSQFNQKLISNSFKSHSEAQNLKEKTSWLDRQRERVVQKMTEYQLQDLSEIDI